MVLTSTVHQENGDWRISSYLIHSVMTYRGCCCVILGHIMGNGRVIINEVEGVWKEMFMAS